MAPDEVREEVRKAILRTGLSPLAFATAAKVDPGTLYDYLGGKRKPSSKSRAKIEEALGWPVGSINAMYLGDPVPEVPSGTASGTTKWTGSATGVVGPASEPVGPGTQSDPAGAYISRRSTEPELADVPLDALLAEIARRARAGNPEADR